MVLGCGSHAGGGSGLDGGTAAGGGGGAFFGAGGSVLGASGTAGMPIGESADAGCRRDVSLKAVTLGKPPPFDVVIVADNSDSLSWSRDDLSSGLSDLLGSVRGRSVRVFLLTPTQYGASSAAAQEPLTGQDVVDWKSAATGQPYANAVTTYAQTCTDASSKSIPCPPSRGLAPYQAHGTWTLQMASPIAVITPDLSAADFAVQQKAVRDAILALGGGGSPHEQPICTLSRYVTQDRSALPGHAVFVVISDEDDQTTPKDCLASYDASVTSSAEQQVDPTPCTSGCDAYRYSATADIGARQSTLDCAAFDDTGKQIAGSDKQTALNLGNLASCDGFVSRPCTPDEVTQATPICPAGTNLVTCQATCTSSTYPCSVELPDSTVDACTHSFTKDGMSYANLADYCGKTSGGVGMLHGCTGGGIKYEPFQSVSGTYNPVPLMSGTTTQDMISYFRSQASAAFGADQYLVEAIALAPSFSCTLGPGQSYATNLIQLAGKSDNVFPLCQSYAGALRGVVDFSQNLVQTDFGVPLAADENITTVHIVGEDGSDRTLGASDYGYDHASQVLSVQRSALGAMDATLRVEITSDCRPIIR